MLRLRIYSGVKTAVVIGMREMREGQQEGDIDINTLTPYREYISMTEKKTKKIILYR